MSLTDAGEVFLHYAREITRQREGYEIALRKLADSRENTIALGVLPTMAQYDITNIIFTYQRKYPKTKLSLTMADTYDLQSLLEEGTLDFAFLRVSEGKKQDESLSSTIICEDELVAVIPVSNPLARCESITLSQLRNEDICVLETNTLIYDLCVEHCKNAGFEIRIFYHGHHLTNIADFVTKGQAVALLMREQTRFMRNPKIKVISVDPPIKTLLCFCYSRTRRFGEAASNFVDTVNKFIKTGSPEIEKPF